MSAFPSNTPDGDDTQGYTKLQKLAALFVMLGPEASGRILMEFDEAEIDAVATEMAKLTVIDQTLQEEALREFGTVAIEASTALCAGAEAAHATLEKALGESKASTVISRVAPNRQALPSLQPLLRAEPREIFNLVRNEPPQTIAVVISHFPPEKASPVLALFTTELRESVVERLATLAPTPVEVIERIVSVLTQKLQSTPARAVSRVGGVKSAAAVLNSIGKKVSKELLESIEKRNPDLSNAIRQKMFTFEDLGRLDKIAVQKVLRSVDTRDLALALKKANDATKAALLGGISKRAAETVKEEMAFLTSPKARDIDTAQNRIVEAVRQLESEGEIEIGTGREETALDEAA